MIVSLFRLCDICETESVSCINDAYTFLNLGARMTINKKWKKRERWRWRQRQRQRDRW